MKKEKMKNKLIAMDLDGTLCQHRSPLPPENKEALAALTRHFHLVMVGAGTCRRIYNQMEQFPVDIIGNYGLQAAVYDSEKKDLVMIRDEVLPCDSASIYKRAQAFREKYGYLTYKGKAVEYHPSGAVTIPILGTEAVLADKLAFDPDRSKRRAIYQEVVELFPEYNVFVGGSSSYDMVPKPHNKAHALEEYCREQNIKIEESVFIGDDYGPGGNDEAVFKSNFRAIGIDDYRKFPMIAERLIREAEKAGE